MKSKRIFIFILLLIFLSGCALNEDEIYKRVKTEAVNVSKDAQDSFLDTLSKDVYLLSIKAKKIAPPVIILSILFGILLLTLITDDVLVRKTTVKLFFITIPLIMLLLSYGTAFIYGVFK